MKATLLICCLILAGCGSAAVMLVHPKTAERVNCTDTSEPLIASRPAFYYYVGRSLFGRDRVADCAKQYEGLGFVRAENLTEEQRANILSNPRPIEIKLQQEITVKKEDAKTPPE